MVTIFQWGSARANDATFHLASCLPIPGGKNEIIPEMLTAPSLIVYMVQLLDVNSTRRIGTALPLLMMLASSSIVQKLCVYGIVVVQSSILAGAGMPDLRCAGCHVFT